MASSARGALVLDELLAQTLSITEQKPGGVCFLVVGRMGFGARFCSLCGFAVLTLFAASLQAKLTSSKSWLSTADCVARNPTSRGACFQSVTSRSFLHLLQLWEA